MTSTRFSLTLLPSAAADLRGVPPGPRQALRDALRRLRSDPRRPGALDVKLLRSTRVPPPWRLRVGDWRAVYVIDGSDVVVLRFFHRSEGYAWLDG
jgi:mRNA-degrading endonuclease RelE of RelBE toxin-antitoxin system